jgi:hypothetical protein
MTSRIVTFIAFAIAAAQASAVDITKLPPMDEHGWPLVIELRGRHLEALDIALHQFREDRFSTSGDLKHFTVEVRRSGDRLAVGFLPEHHIASSRSLPGRNKYGTFITYFVSLRTLKIIGFHFERD